MHFSQSLVIFLFLAGASFAAEAPEGNSAWLEKVHATSIQDPSVLVGVVRAASEAAPYQASEILGAALSKVPDHSTEQAMALVGAAIDGVTAAKLNASQSLECYDAVFAKAAEFIPHFDGVAQESASGSKAGMASGSKGGLPGGAKGGMPSRTGSKGGLPPGGGDSPMATALSQLAVDTYSRLESRVLAARLLSPWDVDRFGGTIPNSTNSGGGAGIGGDGIVSPYTP